MPEARERPTAVLSVLLPGTAMIAVTFGLARYGYGLLLPDMRAEIGMTAGTAGLVSSAAYASYLVANIGVVELTTRWGPRLAVGGAAALAAVGMLAIAVADGVALLAVGVLVAGAAAGMAFPPYADIVDREVAPSRRDVVWSTISSGTGWGVALAGPIAIVAGGQWRTAWAVFVVLAVVVGIMATIQAPAREGDRLRRPQLSVSWFFCPKSRPLLVSAVLVGGGSSTWWAFSVDAMWHAGLDATSARIVYAVCGAAMLLASISGVVFERRGLRPSYLGSTALLAVSLALLAFATSNVVAVLIAAVLFGAFYATVIAAHGIWSARVFAGHPAAGLAAVSTALTIGTLAGPVLAGIAIQYAGYAPALIGAAAVTVLAIPFCPPTAERRKILAAHEGECTAKPIRP
jgi:predicted MFS family arabinose efflux permease